VLQNYHIGLHSEEILYMLSNKCFGNDVNKSELHSIRRACLLPFNSKSVVLSVVVYGCEAWSVTLRGECRFKVYENKVLRRIFRPKKKEVIRW
jgi:hypothetical protein